MQNCCATRRVNGTTVTTAFAVPFAAAVFPLRHMPPPTGVPSPRIGPAPSKKLKKTKKKMKQKNNTTIWQQNRESGKRNK